MIWNSTLRRLLSDVRRLLEKASNHKSVDHQLVDSYWGIGRRITEAGVLKDAAYGNAVVRSLSQTLEVDLRTLQRSIAFYRLYSQPPRSGLTWAHYRELLTLSEPKERSFYEQLVVDEKLSRDRLVLAIESDVFSQKGRAKRNVTLKRPKDVRYVYTAQLLRVIDGDTLLLDIDLGFEVTKRQRVRLALINTFSLESKKGQAAMLLVAERLSVADRIVVHTKRADLHGRYLAHIFYSTKALGFDETFTRGRYLNQELLDEKLAMRMR